MSRENAFSFGKNWKRFLRKLDGECLESAAMSLTGFLGMSDLKGKMFVDAGCGSGLFSNAAHRLGAERVVSFDVDPFSVECCKYLRAQAGEPENWKIYEGSVLDEGFLGTLGQFDIVYSWGVLHHTGRMWAGIRNTGKLVRPGGYFYISIYNKAGGLRGSEFWLRVKKFYNASPSLGKLVLEFTYRALFLLRRWLRLRNPLREIEAYRSLHRGMDWSVDITDWLGGYPYEFAAAGEVFQFVKTHFPDFNLANMKTTDNVDSNSFLFVNAPLAICPGSERPALPVSQLP